MEDLLFSNISNRRVVTKGMLVSWASFRGVLLQVHPHVCVVANACLESSVGGAATFEHTGHQFKP